MAIKPQRLWTVATLLLLSVSAYLSNRVLFQQTVKGTTQLTRNISSRIGVWVVVDESPASASEIKGLETTDIVKRTYSNGSAYIELIVAYIAHSNRKSAHAQEACLRGSGALVGSIGPLAVSGGRVQAKVISLDLHNQKQWVCYWYKIGTVYTAQYLRSSLLMFFGGLFGNTRQGAALVRLLTLESPQENREKIIARFEDFTRSLLPELEKHLP